VTVRAYLLRVLCNLGVLCVAVAPPAAAQFQMPDPKQMSGIPRPVTDLPNGTISVRLIKGELSNNITNHPVELHVGDKVQTVKTDESGRAEFRDLPAGANVKAVAIVDGERLESQEFPVQGQGGIRLMLVATDKEKEKQKQAEASAPAVAGEVSLSSETRIVLEPRDEAIDVFYLLDIVNSARTPVNPAKPFEFDMPSGATSATIMQGSSPKAAASGTHVKVTGPFPPGRTFVQVAAPIPISSGTLNLSQLFPANLEQLSVLVKKVGNLKLSSPLIERQQDMAAQGDTLIVAVGGPIKAGQPVALTLDGLPHQNQAPRQIALVLAVLILIVGVWAATRPEQPGERVAERRRLIARREKLFQDLVRLEHDHRRGRVGGGAYADRREELVAALEHIYGALDTDDTSPEPADRAGLAA